MAVSTPSRPAPAPAAVRVGGRPRRRGLLPTGRARWLALGAVLAAWIALWFALHGRQTLALDPSSLTPLHTRLNSLSDTVDANRNTSPIFLYFLNYVRQFIADLVTFVQALISTPSYGRPVPLIGWLGVLALATGATFLFAGRRVAWLTAAGFVSFGLLGLWQESMDTLALTLVAVVLSLAVGIPLGIWAGLSDRVNRVLTPVLDFMQIMPTFVYLAPLTLVFLIGPASATIATMVYAVPPAIRITAYGIRGVPGETLEAATSLGSTPGQLLRKVRLPLARRAIVVGINQTVMAALAMATIAALIDAPGLGQTVIKALETLDVGTSFGAGLAIVIMAIVLDRVTTAASQRAEAGRRAGRVQSVRGRRLEVGVVGALVGLAGYLSYTYLWAAQFPAQVTLGGRPFSLDAGSPVRRGADQASQWVQDHLYGFTNGVKNVLTGVLLNPFQRLLTESPWWLTAVAILAIVLLVATWRMAVFAAACLGLLVALGLWQDAMATLAASLVGTLLVMVLGIALGVWMGRSERVDRGLRPVLDAGQTLPAFVYLVPILGLFGATRFTAIIAAVAYAAPVAIKLVADGIRGVPATVVESATSAGSNTWQLITKVQLPMARAALTLAANQGLIYVLAMVVVGGLVGAGALGYDVVAGFSQLSLRGKGLAAGLAIVVLGIMLDRVTQATARRAGKAAHRPI